MNLRGFSYSELVDRNWPFIDKALQERISSARLFFAGCGGGGLIAQAAARVGFSNFIFADGDQVEISNLNRQPFYLSDLGLPKTTALKSKILDINPLANIQTIQEYLRADNSEEPIRKSDIIINTVDAGEVVFKIIELGQQYNKHVVTPINIGYGGMVMVFNGETKSLHQILQTRSVSGIDFYKCILERMDIEIPTYICRNLAGLFEGVASRGYNPQLGIGVEVVTSIVLTVMVRIRAGLHVPLMPSYIYKDFFSSNI